MSRFSFLYDTKIIASLMKRDDVEMLEKLHAGAFFYSWGKDVFQTFLRDPHVIGFVARSKGKKIRGFVLARLVAGEAEILSIAVASAYRRQGIGHVLIDTLLCHLHHKQAKVLFLEVDIQNTAAQKLYKHFTFIEVGRRHAYFKTENGYSDAIILRYNIS